jgi:hypothetical protein
VTKDWCRHEGNAVLLVEGENDCHVILALCKKYQVPEAFGIYQCGSDGQALRRMNALIAGPNPPRILGLVIDADNPNLSGRWKSIQGKLSHYGYVFPEAPSLGGTVLDSPSEETCLGFWLMPNNQDDGMLEDFCSEMIAENSLDTVRECIGLAKNKGCATFKEVHYSKAVVHTFLALQDEPGRPLGQAITAQTLKPDTTTAQAFVTWLNRLFVTA